MQIRNIGVFCSADDKIASEYKDAGFELGAAIAENNYHLVSGGGRSGLMKTVIDGYANQENSLHLHAVMPSMFKIYNHHHPMINENNLTWTETVHERLSEFHKLCDVVVVLPGGFGTLHELMDFLVHNQFGIINKKIILINLNHYWDPLLDQFTIMVEAKALRKMHLEHLQVTKNVEECMELIASQNERQVEQGFENHYWEAESIALPDDISSYRITIDNYANPEVDKFIIQKLHADNESIIGPYTHKNFTMAARTDNNELIGGLKGYILGNVATIKLMWVDDRFRNLGVGSRLLKDMETHVIACACKVVHVRACEFQARNFYEKHGYRIVNELEEGFMGFKTFTMRKDLV